MRVAPDKSFIRPFLAVLVLMSVLSPVASLAHGLDHLAEQQAALAASGQAEGIPIEDVDLDAPCDLCDALTGARTAVVFGLIDPVQRIESPDPIAPVTPLLHPRAPQLGPDSQRAPPVG